MLLAFVGVVAFNGLKTSGRALEESDRLTANTLTALAIERNVVALEREAGEYAASGDAAALQRARDLAAQIRDGLQQAETAAGAAEQRPIVRKMIEFETAFSEGLDRVADLRGGVAARPGRPVPCSRSRGLIRGAANVARMTDVVRRPTTRW